MGARPCGASGCRRRCRGVADRLLAQLHQRGWPCRRSRRRRRPRHIAVDLLLAKLRQQWGWPPPPGCSRPSRLRRHRGGGSGVHRGERLGVITERTVQQVAHVFKEHVPAVLCLACHQYLAAAVRSAPVAGGGGVGGRPLPAVFFPGRGALSACAGQPRGTVGAGGCQLQLQLRLPPHFPDGAGAGRAQGSRGVLWDGGHLLEAGESLCNGRLENVTLTTRWPWGCTRGKATA